MASLSNLIGQLLGWNEHHESPNRSCQKLTYSSQPPTEMDIEMHIVHPHSESAMRSTEIGEYIMMIIGLFPQYATLSCNPRM